MSLRRDGGGEGGAVDGVIAVTRAERAAHGPGDEAM